MFFLGLSDSSWSHTPIIILKPNQNNNNTAKGETVKVFLLFTTFLMNYSTLIWLHWPYLSNIIGTVFKYKYALKYCYFSSDAAIAQWSQIVSSQSSPPTLRNSHTLP